MKTVQLRWSEGQTNPPEVKEVAVGRSSRPVHQWLGRHLSRAGPVDLSWWGRGASGHLSAPSSWLLNVQFSMAVLKPLQQMHGPTGCPLHCLSHIHRHGSQTWERQKWREKIQQSYVLTSCSSNWAVYRLRLCVLTWNCPSRKSQKETELWICSKHFLVGYLYACAVDSELCLFAVVYRIVQDRQNEQTLQTSGKRLGCLMVLDLLFTVFKIVSEKKQPSEKIFSRF